MFLHIFIALAVGIFCGIFSGICPGVHINLVSVVLLNLSPLLLRYTDPIVLCVFIIAMAITHTFLDTIPSIFLGAPDSEDALNVLPGHRMLLEGKGLEAVRITIVGSYLCLLLGLLTTPLLIIAAPSISLFLSPYVGYILLAVVIFMVLKDREPDKRIWNLIVFLISGIFGVLVFSIPNFKDPLFPMLSGLFGISGLIISLSENTNIPHQEETDSVKIPFSSQAKAMASGVFSGSLTGIFPGLGAAQAAILAMQLAGDIGNYGFMMLVGGIGTVASLFSLVTLYTIEKARDGAIVVVSEIIGTLTTPKFLVLLATALIAGGVAVWLTMRLARLFTKLMARVNYRYLTIGIIVLIVCLVFYFTSFLGLFILSISAAIGLIAPLKNVGRNNAMGCLLLPVILYFLL
jgi:putative membrane protein